MEAHKNPPQSAEAPDLIIWDVVEEHLHEAEFLFDLWRARLFAPHYTYYDIAERLEPRLEAHLDGLRIGGVPVAERLLIPLLEEAEYPELAAVATLVLLDSEVSTHRHQPIRAFETAKGETLQGITLGLALSDSSRLGVNLLSFFEIAREPEVKAHWLEIIASRHLDPGRQLEECLRAAHPPLRRAALRAASRGGRRDLAPLAKGLLADEHPGVRTAAIEAGLIFGMPQAWSACLAHSNHHEPGSGWAMGLVALLGSRQDYHQLHRSLGDETRREAALFALGFTGSVESADICLPFLRSNDERLAKLAAEAIASIAGFDLLDSELKANAEATETQTLPPLAEDDLEADLVPDAVEDLPTPNPVAIEHRWSKVRRNLKNSQRYLDGQPQGPEALVRALVQAPTRRRHNLALELALRTGGARWVSTRSFSRRQRAQLQSLSTLERREMTNNFIGSW